MTSKFDAVVIGAGMVGASIAAELATKWRVLLIDMEQRAGYHSTGRSAALFVENYENKTLQKLTRASRSFFSSNEGLVGREREVMVLARSDQLESFEQLMQEFDRGSLRRIDAKQARKRCPIIREGYVAACAAEEGAFEIDVGRMHQRYLRAAREGGSEIILNAEVQQLDCRSSCWQVVTGRETFAARVVINAAGAWADEIARRGGLEPLGLQPRLRTAVLVDPPKGNPVDDWPMVVDVDQQFYFKPDAQRILVSPADETPVAPCDAAADEMGVALAIDRFEMVTGISVERVRSKWAGLRSFFADRSPVIGYGNPAQTFFWAAGLGGVGIQTAPAVSRLSMALILGRDVPTDLAEEGFGIFEVAPDRMAVRS